MHYFIMPRYGKKRSISRREIARMIKYPPGEFATVKIPRDPATRDAALDALKVGNLKPAIPYTDRYTLPRWYGSGLYTGKGGFWGDMWSKSAGLRGKLGGFLRGGGAGSWGQAGGHAMQALGMGEYGVGNDIVNGGAGQDIPNFGSAPMSAVTVTHKEYISDVFAPASFGTFQNTVYSINPGIERTFPWLSQVACNYEEYTLKQLIFTFRSTVTDFVATNGQVGTIIMATQYNPSDAPFQSKQDAMEYEASMSGKCSQNMLHGVECDPAQLSGATGKYLRAGPVRASDDLKQYDWGNLNIGVSNIPQEFENQSLGELWVSYTVELRKPKFFVTRGLNILRDTFVGDTPGGSLPLDQLTLGYAQQNRIGGVLTAQPDYLQYTFPATFSGTVKVVVTFDKNTPSPVAVSQALQAGLSATSNLNAAGKMTGILPIFDIWSKGAWTYFSDCPGTIIGGVTSNPPLYSGSCEFHFMIVTPTTSGAVGSAVVDNTLYFIPQNLDTPAVPQTCSNYHIDIEVYNAGGFNYSQQPQPSLPDNQTLQLVTVPAQGSNVIVENPITGMVETWP
nr:MAG: capsid protein [Chemarfal virus 202]